MSVLPPIDIHPEDWTVVLNILDRHLPRATIYAFGSRARRSAKPYSDLDLTVRNPEPLSLAQLAAIEDDFTDSRLPFRVDVVDWASLGEPFRRSIEPDLVPIRAAVA